VSGRANRHQAWKARVRRLRATREILVRGAGGPRRLRRSLGAGSGIEEAGFRLKEAFVASFYAIVIAFVAVSLLNLIEYRRLD
jgi:hypothetical protein